MAVSKEKKSEILAILEQHLKESVSVGFTSNTALTALDVFTMKRELRAANTTFMLAKKTLMRLAFKNVHGIDLDLDTLPGQVAIIFSKGDKVAGLAIVNKFAAEWKKEGKIKFVGGYFDGVILDAKAISRIAGLPSREVLLAKLLGSMMSPLSGLARFFDAAGKDMEAKSLKTTKDLIGSAPAPAKVDAAPVAAETPAEVVAPAVEVAPTPEAPTEEVATEVTPEAPTEEVAVVEEAPATEEVAATV